MVEIVKFNDENLRDDEIDEVVLRVKAFIISSKNNVLIGRDNEGYKLLETSVEADEDIITKLKNYIYLETGIGLDGKDSVEPFYEVRHYNKDYKGTGINRLSDTIYFLIKSDKLPNYKKLKLRAEEMAKRLPIEVIRRSQFASVLKEYVETEQNVLYKTKTKEILLAFDKLKDIPTGAEILKK